MGFIGFNPNKSNCCIDMRYAEYTVEDFVSDEYFQKWILDTDTMTSNYWNRIMDKYPKKKDAAEEARRLILLMNHNNDHLKQEDFDAIWHHIIEKRSFDFKKTTRKPKKRQRTLYWKYAGAASVLLLIAVTFFKDVSIGFEKPEVAVATVPIEIGSSKALLTLGDGSIIALNEGEAFESTNMSSNGEEIVYIDTRANKKPEYNLITIPKGGQFLITLSDGTQVWLNSESQLKYPTHFIEGENRIVELVYGEAYFDVTPSSEYHGSGFKVFNNQQEVDVLGTEFNIKAYKDEVNIYTTLVEGNVAIRYSGKNIKLKPSQQSIIDSNNNAVVKTIDVFNEVSWKDGVFSFENKTLKEIMKVLSRWYDVTIVFENESIAEELFFGILDKNQNIEEILNSIKNFEIIKDYEIRNKTIKLK